MVFLSAARSEGDGVRFDTEHPLEHALGGATATSLDTVDGSGIRDLRIEFSAAGHTSTRRRAGSIQHGIQLKYTSDFFIHGVTSGTANSDSTSLGQRRGQWGAHVVLFQSYRCSITGSDFVDASLHGNGGEGYGISFSNNTTRCRVEDNTFRRLRHSILLQEGATANVIGYNYSRDPYHTNFTPGGPADMSFHGYQTANLVEGNVMERIHVDDNGGSGQRNVILRNCLYSGPLTLQNSDQNAFVWNAVFGSEVRLDNRWMPPSVGTDNPAIVTQPAKRYTTGSSGYFDGEGFRRIGSNNQANIEYGNWFANSRQSGGDTPVADSYYASSHGPVMSNPSSAEATCTNDAVVRAGDFGGPNGAFNGRQQ